jgi:AbrB family looped-hinge helix DNA binding protein
MTHREEFGMSAKVTISEEFSIVIPEEVRQELHLKPGDQVLVDAWRGYVLLVPEGRDYVELLRGLHREIWEGVDPQEYIRQERESW